ncbi:MAG TPA: sulfite exporter TauE/SafE family protein, partial [Vicinamibacteria bacterium]|nr:sulfite exporter TauE/SafE family protein [Vicinamibacteria bacterium]
ANSVAGLAGQMVSMPALPRLVPVWAAVAATGGWIGAHWGSRKLPSAVLRRLLAIVLVVAGGKLLLTR